MLSPPTKKRKLTIDDFFSSSSKDKQAKSEGSLVESLRKKGDDKSSLYNAKCTNQDLKVHIDCDGVRIIPQPSQTAVPGVTLHNNFVSCEEEAQILSFLNDAGKCTWRTDLSRRTMHFGGEYCLMPPKVKQTVSNTIPQTNDKPQIFTAPPVPSALEFLIDRMVERNIYEKNKRPQYCIVNEYTGNLGISAHTENFSFGEPVVGLSLLSDCPMRFREMTKPDGGSVRSGKAAKAEKTGRMVDVPLRGRSLVVMTGEGRWKWQHEIMRSAKGRGPGWKRVSLTFRWKSGG